LRITQLSVRGFRNLVEQEIDLNHDAVLFAGKNGQGKTSVLEAIFTLSQGKSFRSSHAREMLSWDTAYAILPHVAICEGEFETRDGNKHVRFEVSAEKRQVFLNEKPVIAAHKFYGQVACSVFTPDDLQLVKGAPAERRRFLDRLLSTVDAEYVEHLVQYQRTLKQRNAVLNRAAKDNWTERRIEQELAPWTEMLISHGLIICDKRQRLCLELGKTVASYYQRLSADSPSRESLSLRLESGYLQQDGLRSREELLSTYLEQRTRDYRRQATNLGVHRDDLQLFLDSGCGPKDAKMAASQGQSRTSALSLVLAGIDYAKSSLQEPPIVLLDDVESELDSGRREALGRLIVELKAQVIVTATDISEAFRAPVRELKIFKIEAGKITLL
jgi:DNA replication and repair protein RecF